jgi:hypothetical protein
MGSYHWPAPRRRCEGAPGLRPWQSPKLRCGCSVSHWPAEFYRKEFTVVHVIVDGEIDTPKLRARDPNRATETIISPDSIADIVLFYVQTNARRLDARTRPATSPGVVVKFFAQPISIGD